VLCGASAGGLVRRRRRAGRGGSRACARPMKRRMTATAARTAISPSSRVTPTLPSWTRTLSRCPGARPV